MVCKTLSPISHWASTQQTFYRVAGLCIYDSLPVMRRRKDKSIKQPWFVFLRGFASALPIEPSPVSRAATQANGSTIAYIVESLAVYLSSHWFVLR